MSLLNLKEYTDQLAQKAFIAAVAPYYTQALYLGCVDTYFLCIAVLWQRKWADGSRGILVLLNVCLRFECDMVSLTHRYPSPSR